MIEVVEFEPEHLDMLDIQEAQRIPEQDRRSFMGPYGDSWTVMLDGHPIACGGFVKIWHERAAAWSLLGKEAKDHLLFITRAVRRGMDTSGYRRVEISVQAGFDEGMHWARMLGFTLETPEPAKAYLPNGADAYLFSRVRLL